MAHEETAGRRASTGLPAALSDRRFWVHVAQMVAVMVLGMAVGMPALHLLGPALDGVEAHTLAMAGTMTAAMVAWMAWRRHGRAAIAEMAAAMYVPFLVLFPLFWLGWLDGAGVSVAGHVLMLPAMLLVMLRRPAEYTGH